jgi:hypothetical protein
MTLQPHVQIPTALRSSGECIAIARFEASGHASNSPKDILDCRYALAVLIPFQIIKLSFDFGPVSVHTYYVHSVQRSSSHTSPLAADPGYVVSLPGCCKPSQSSHD